jgi:hypothetical protein
MKNLFIISLITSGALLGGCGGGGGSSGTTATTTAAYTDLSETDMLAKASITTNKAQLNQLMSQWSLSPLRRVASTRQTACFDNTKKIICPKKGEPFSGQDASYSSSRLPYLDRNDGTVIDTNTGLTWTRGRYGKLSFQEAIDAARNERLGGYSDWRVPTIKELYSLADFDGYFGTSAATSKPFIDKVFEFAYGNEAIGERFIDVQEWSSNQYVGTTFSGDATIFGVNFADGRIKGYPLAQPGTGGALPQKMFVRFVRGVPNYGVNKFFDNGNGTITDRTTRLQWQKSDDGITRNWQAALAYCEALSPNEPIGWRLPNAKELQSIVDYTRAPVPVTSNRAGPAIEPIFVTTSVESYFWTSTTLLDGPPDIAPSRAAYIAFGRALGYVQVPPGSGNFQLIDVHGAGSQRADPKVGNPADYPQGFGPQGDDVRIANYVRCVRG